MVGSFVRLILGTLRTILGRSWSGFEHLRSHLEASCAILSYLGGYIGLSLEVLLEPTCGPKGKTTDADAQKAGGIYTRVPTFCCSLLC
eukprot:8958268-Pyramimonas_sp.AAC.4